MNAINQIEIFVNTFLQGLGTWLIGPMRLITALGYEQFFALLLPTIYWRFDQLIGLRVGIVLMLGSTTNLFFKFLFHNPRPYWISDNVKAFSYESSFGLPSGHAQIGATMWGWLAVEIKKTWFTLLALSLIILIGFSRLYLGVHFLSDVVLGWALGGLTIWLFSAWYKRVGAWIEEQKIFIKLVLVCVSTIGIITSFLAVRWVNNPWKMPNTWLISAGGESPYALESAFSLGGTWFGMLAGFILLQAKKGFFIASWGEWKRIARFLVGMIGLFILYYGLGFFLPNRPDIVSYALRFIQYNLIGLWVSWWGPLLFERLNLLRFEGKLK